MPASPLMTWYGLWMTGTANAGLTIDEGFNTSTNALAQMSKAEHQLQVFTNAARHTVTVNVDALATPSGIYPADIDIKQMLTAQFVQAGTVNAVDVKPVPFEEIDDRIRGDIPLGQIRAPMYYTFDQGNIQIFPVAGITGVLTIKYIPHLMPFDPSAPIGRWASFTGSVAAVMKTTGPAREFGTAMPAIADYLTMYLIESQAGGVKRHAERYQRALSGWEEAKRFNVKDTVQMNKRRQFPGRNGVVK